MRMTVCLVMRMTVVVAMMHAMIRRPVAIGPNTLNMMVMADLGRAHIILIAYNLFTVFAELAVHGVIARKRLMHALNKRFDYIGMIVQIGCLQNFNVRIGRLRFICPRVDAPDQNAGKQKIGKHDDTLVAQPDRPLQARINQRIGDSGIADLGPTEAHTFPQHAGDLRYIGIGIRIIGATANNHQQRIFTGNGGRRCFFRLFDPLCSGGQQSRVNAKLAPEDHFQIRVIRAIVIDL